MRKSLHLYIYIVAFFISIVAISAALESPSPQNTMETREIKNVLIVYLTRTGHTEKLAKQLEEKFTDAQVKLVKLVDTQDRYSSVLGYIRASIDSECEIELQPADVDFAAADLILVGTPIWSWALPPPTRSFFKKYKANMEKTPWGLFHSMGNNGEDRCNTEATAIVGTPPIAQLSVSERRHWGKEKGALVERMVGEYHEHLVRIVAADMPESPRSCDSSASRKRGSESLDASEGDKVLEPSPQKRKTVKVGKGAFLYWEQKE